VCVPAVIGALVVYRQNTHKKFEEEEGGIGIGSDVVQVVVEDLDYVAGPYPPP